MGSTPGAGRAGLAVAAVAALGASFLLGVVVAGGAGPTVAPPPGIGPSGPPVGTSPPLRLAHAALTAPGSCEALLASYVGRGVERVGPYGWDFPVYAAMEGGAVAEDGLAQGSAAAPGSRVVEQRSSETGTNVQETGVDEPDVVKTDGALLARVHDGELLLLDVSGRVPVELGDTDLPAAVPSPELLLAGDTVVVTGSAAETTGERETRVLTYDVSDPAAPLLVDHRGYDAGLVRAVQHDDVVRLVLGSGLPELDFVEPRFWRDEEEAREANRAIVERSEVTDWLPTVTTYDGGGRATGTSPLLDCGQVTVPRDTAALGTMSVVGFEADEPEEATVIGVATDTRLAYFSADRLYLATSDASTWGCCVDVRPMPPVDGPWPQPPTGEVGRSRIHAFSLEDDSATYVASGVVDGVIVDRWSMDEHDGVLRLALGPSAETGDFSSVVTLREDGDDLEELGRVDGLGVGEDITSVRWFDGLAIVVTFRQVDPLYPVDLRDPAEPRLLGELKIPGFSDYLHPISGQRLIGMGQDASLRGMLRGAQAALFDVSDLTEPRQTDLVRYGKGSTAAAGADPRQFTWLPEQETALTVVSRGWEGTTGWVSVLEVSGDSLSHRMVEVEHGSDVGEVRLVPLPDGRVVLVTADDVAFFEP